MASRALLLTYDLPSASRHRRQFLAFLQSFETGWHHLDRAWILKTDLSSREVRDLAAELLGDNDQLLVIDISGDACAWYGLAPAASQWLKAQL